MPNLPDSTHLDPSPSSSQLLSNPVDSKPLDPSPPPLSSISFDTYALPLPLHLRDKGKARELSSSTPSLRSASRLAKNEGGSISASVLIGGIASDSDEARRRSRAGSKSFHGGVNQTFMHILNALSLEEPEVGGNGSELESEDVASDTSEGEEEEEEDEEDEVERSTASTSTSIILPPPLHNNESLSSSNSSLSNIDPPSFLSPLPSSYFTSSLSHQAPPSSSESAISPTSPRSSPEEQQQDSEIDIKPEAEPLASSLYAIHRPIAARRRTITGERGEYIKEGMYTYQAFSSPRLATSSLPTLAGSIEVEEEKEVETIGRGGGVIVRDRSATVASRASGKSLTRKRKLAEKLEDIFGLEGSEEVLAEFHCWLFRSVLLQGFMYLTTGHICFYAYLPHKEGATVRSGTLSVRGSKTRRYYKHWFILKDAVLAWYPSSTDPYFPDGHVDLHYCTSVEASTKHPDHFKVYTAEKKWHFRADSEASRDEWIRTIKKVVFRCQNEGESVKISIPLEAIIDIEHSTNLEFAETIRIRVYDADEGYSIDEYWLSYFTDLNGALEKMLKVLNAFRENNPQLRNDDLVEGEEKPSGIEGLKIETGVARRPSRSGRIHSTLGHSGSESSPSRSNSVKRSKSLSRKSNSSPSPLPLPPGSTWSTALSSRLRLFPSSPSTDRKLSASLATLTSGTGTTTPTNDSPSLPPHLFSSTTTYSNLTSSILLDPTLAAHTYPPEPTTLPPLTDTISTRHTTWTIPTLASVPTWLKGPTKKLSEVVTTGSNLVAAPRKILEFVSGSVGVGVGSSAVEGGQTGGGILGAEANEERFAEEPDAMEEDEEEKVNEKFRLSFGLTDKETVLAHFPAYLFRGLPIYGKVYISTTFFCFKSIGILAKTKMILPLNDIIAVSRHRSYRIGYSGLIVVIKGHEELFFELSSSERREDCMTQLETQVDLVQRLLRDGELPGDTVEHRDHMDLLELAASGLSDDESDPRPSHESSRQPPLMFCSTSSDFVNFRPEKSLKFTCLTIGSRGDVQPYIALCKGLMAEGHTCKIASHGEYRQWVEGHGIAFEEVGGDPAELMQLMIAHDFFTISFMKEAVGRFRGWLDDLLETTWKACQGSDVLIESPSAIAGFHIAEALRIPYYRAFTMPWSRTRAYPHAFAVPDHKMGGGYNYMTYTMFDQIFWRATSGQVNRWRKKTLGLGSTSLEAMQVHKIPFLYNFSPVIIPPPLDWRENIHVTGYWWLDNPDDSNAHKWQPPPELITFLDLAKTENKKVVFIGFGSIIIPDPDEMTRVVTEAVVKSGVYAIVAKGWSDRASTKDDSDQQRLEIAEQERKEAVVMKGSNIFNIKSIPHDWLFPRIDAAVHHGGSGTTGASLRAGLPTIIKPFFGDQHFYADRVATLGIGSAVRNMTVDNLAAAIITAVTDDKQISRAKLAGEAIRKEDGVGNAIQCIYRDLDYAKSLIPALQVPKNPPQSDSIPILPPPITASVVTPLPLPASTAITGFHQARSKAGSSEGDWDVLSVGSGGGGSRVGESRRGTWDESLSRGSSRIRSGPASSRGDDEMSDSSEGELIGASSMEGSRNSLSNSGNIIME